MSARVLPSYLPEALSDFDSSPSVMSDGGNSKIPTLCTEPPLVGRVRHVPLEAIRSIEADGELLIGGSSDQETVSISPLGWD